MRHLSLFLLTFSVATLSAGCKTSENTASPDIAAAIAPKAPVQDTATAYGSAKFGMTFEQVAALPQFKDWFLDKDKPAISHFNEPIGQRTYRVSLFFYRDRLYRVDFTTADDAYLPKAQYETDIRGEIGNLRDYFSRTYGDPATDNGLPRSTGLNRGMVTFVYKWRADNRMITLGVSESAEGGGFKTVAQYYDVAAYQAARTERP